MGHPDSGSGAGGPSFQPPPAVLLQDRAWQAPETRGGVGLVSTGKGGLRPRSWGELWAGALGAGRTQRLRRHLAGLPPGATFRTSLVHSA